MLAKDFPIDADVEYQKTTSAWSDRVSDVKVNAFGVMDFELNQGEVRRLMHT